METTIPSSDFEPSIEGEIKFIDYVKQHLMCHKSIENFTPGVKRRIQNNLIEIFQNIRGHARTEDPVFICGQYYPSRDYFILTIVDLGIGFLHL